ncbi:CLUMA_CG009761, isoform A [Clunio marinus]|uniref:CLUMA_CG009761, isoform A n=1 Tax=Clunio marinus TaxID=568069 RepID=A0A1J1IBI3_9DIPT|nr:CLUMA_CG009761, isoform A [Clunio marinus]
MVEIKLFIAIKPLRYDSQLIRVDVHPKTSIKSHNIKGINNEKSKKIRTIAMQNFVSVEIIFHE